MTKKVQEGTFWVGESALFMLMGVLILQVYIVKTHKTVYLISVYHYM